MKSQGADFVSDQIGKNIHIGDGTADSAPHHSAIANFFAKDNFADCGAKGELR